MAFRKHTGSRDYEVLGKPEHEIIQKHKHRASKKSAVDLEVLELEKMLKEVEAERHKRRPNAP